MPKLIKKCVYLAEKSDRCAGKIENIFALR